MKRAYCFYIPFYFFILFLLILILLVKKGELHLTLCTYHSPLGDFFFKYFTDVGGSIPFFVAGILLFYRYKWAIFIVVSVELASALTRILKSVFKLPRPKVYFEEYAPHIQLHGVAGVTMHAWNSFPSGHTTAAFAFFTCLALLNNNKLVQFWFFLLAVLAGYSRIYLSQHFAGDILAGAIVGVSVSTLCYIFVYRKYLARLGPIRGTWKGPFQRI